jgi:hypothetical protein
MGDKSCFARPLHPEDDIMSSEEDLRTYAAKMGIFLKNRQAFPVEELMKYAGQWVAWSPDGTHIVAGSSESEEAVWGVVVAAGYDPHECVFSFMGEPD